MIYERRARLHKNLEAENLKERGDIEVVDNLDENLIDELDNKANNRAQEGIEDGKNARQ